MDLGVIRGTGTVTLLVAFVVLCFWAWSPRQKKAFDEAAMLPFAGDDRAAGEVGRAAR
jgi:cytochrome c oxidase cbb3-type subunit IV